MLTGFTPAQIQTLVKIHHDTRAQLQYTLDKKQYGIDDYWPTPEEKIAAITQNAKFKEDCDGFAIVCMEKAINAGFTKVRLVVCYDELGEGHCIVEVASDDESASYFIDNRRVQLAAKADEHGYKFLGVSPWNPQPGETRPWFLVDDPKVA